jgi:fibronectin-binding autotransporter adhesin
MFRPETAGADVYWKGGAGDFSVAAGWNTGSVPVSTQNADVYDGGVVTLTTAETVFDLRVGTGGSAAVQTGAGSVIQSAGSSVTVSAWLRIASFDNTHAGTGAFTLDGGVLNVNAGYADIGESGIGTMNINGGAFYADAPATKYLQVGGAVSDSVGTGVLNLNNGLVSTTDTVLIGAYPGSTGTVNINGGSFTDSSTGGIGIGNAVSAAGTVNVAGGTFNVSGTGPVILGNSNAASGVWNVTGGAVNLTATTDSNIIEIANVNGASGVLNITGTGVVTTSDSDVYVGKYGTGVLNVSSGGVLNVGGWIAIGRNGGTGAVNPGPGGTITKTPGSIGAITFGGNNNVLNQTGGTLNNVASETWIGQYGTSVYNMSGGTANLAAIVLGHLAGASGTINLTGGTLSVSQIEMGPGSSGVLNFNGGILQASATGNVATAGTFLSGITAANVLAGGAVIDTNGQNITVAQSLLHGSGTAVDGGLTKIGAGNLTLASPGTYTGGTAVTAGSLTVANPAALGTGAVTLTGNSTLVLAASTTLNGFPNETLNGGATLGGGILTLTDGGLGESRSAFATNAIPINDRAGFTAHFIWTATKGVDLADGIVFTVQNDPRGSTALGDSGTFIGYQGAPGTADGITNSGAIANHTYHNGGAAGGTGITDGINGVLMTRTNGNGIALSTDPVEVDVSYTAGDMHLMLTDLTLGTTASADYPMDLGTLLNGSAGYVGFTGATGANSSTQTITGFSFSNNEFVPVSIANAVTAAAGTRSVLQAVVAAGNNGAGVGPVTVTAGSTLILSANAPTGSAVRVVLTTPSLTIAGSAGAWTGTLDLQGNDLDGTGGNLAAITDQVRSGYNLPGGGRWDGTGITSSAAEADTSHLTALGVIQNNQSGTAIYSPANLFDGVAPGPGDVLVKYTYFGDANLDGRVDGSDYALIDAGYASGGALTGWYNGDFNYDGVVDGSDYALIDNAFNNQGARLTSPTALVAAVTGEVSPSAVPEPASLGLLGLTAAGLFGRRHGSTGLTRGRA